MPKLAEVPWPRGFSRPLQNLIAEYLDNYKCLSDSPWRCVTHPAVWRTASTVATLPNDSFSSMCLARDGSVYLAGRYRVYRWHPSWVTGPCSLASAIVLCPQ